MTQSHLWDPALIQRYNLNGPRYTSYPTAPQFSEEFNEAQWRSVVESSNQKGTPLSLYFHIPFCDTICYYCGCNKIVTADKQKAVPYLESLEKELSLQARWLDNTREVKQLHWGGGTPTYLSDPQKQQLMDATRKHFRLSDDGEYSIEIHPQGLKPANIKFLRGLGFNRLSMGVQDFDPAVQKAVNRFNSESEVRALVDAAREYGFESISLDLIYGLPLQSKTSLEKTLDKVIDLSPDRLSLFNYAHMPHLFKTQRQIDERTLPPAEEKLAMLGMAIEKLQAAGYLYIGMDHFAKPNDELAIAQQAGKLHRNFQGYATHGNCDMLGFGVSSIAMIDNCYVQNHKRLDDYYQSLSNDNLPISKGIPLSKDDQLRREIINQLICHFSLDFSIIEKKWQINFKDYFANSLQDLQGLANDGLLELSPQTLKVNESGRLLIRRVCMAFDAYLEQKAHSQDPIIARSSSII